jgi:netrin receptor unc-5
LGIGKVTSTCGGIFSMEKKYGVALLISEKKESALDKNKKILLSLLKNENFEWKGATIVSPFVLINEMDNTMKLNRPVILRIPHCMIDIRRWKISLYFSKNSIDIESNGQSVTWCKITTVNEEDINTPVFLQIEKNFINISTETIGKFVLVGSSIHPDTMPACKSMKLLFFSLMQSNGSFISRVYIVNNLYDSIEYCMKYERENRATFLGYKNILFFDNKKDLIVQLKYAHSNYQTNTVSFGNIWHCSTNTRLLHCDFTIDLNQFPMDVNCSNMKVIAYQDHKDDKTSIYSIIPLKRTLNTLLLEENKSNPQLPSSSQLIVTQHHSASVPLVNAINRMDLVGSNDSIAGNLKISEFLLTKSIRKQICLKLDPPTEKRNDWRLFAQKLNADRYLPYFASQASPTNVLLDFWELGNWYAGSNSLHDLIHIFVSMDREDVAAIIENEKTPTWI